MEIEQAALSDSFNKAQKLYESFEAGDNCDEEHYSQAITLLDAITKAVKACALFSPNEDFAEIKTENLKYVLIPFYLGNVYSRSMKERKECVKKSNVSS